MMIRRNFLIISNRKDHTNFSIVNAIILPINLKYNMLKKFEVYLRSLYYYKIYIYIYKYEKVTDSCEIFFQVLSLKVSFFLQVIYQDIYLCQYTFLLICLYVLQLYLH